MNLPTMHRQRFRIAVVNRQTTCRVNGRRLVRVARHVLAAERALRADVEIAVVHDREMARLNRMYLGHRGPTDVLSFDFTEKGEHPFFQIVVSVDTAKRQAERLNHSTSAELALYVTHGLLHLLGYDDGTAASRRRMNDRQRELVRSAGFRLRQ